MDSKYLVVLAVVIFIGAAHAQSESSVSGILGSLPAEYQDKLNSTQVEELKNKSTALIKEKCDKNGGPDVYLKVQKEFESFPKCVTDSLGLSDPAVLQKEIEDAKPNGAVDEVFKKYCSKTPQVKECFLNTLETVKPCFTAKEQDNLQILRNITEQLTEFVCFKEGDRIALFIAEGGPECYQEKTEEVQKCVNETFGADYKFDSANITANTIPEINFGNKECQQFLDLQKCVVGALESCKTPTSANIVESLFKFARKATPCTEPENTRPDAASGLVVTSSTIAFAAAVALLL